MHPVIRIICFLVFVASLSRANAGQLFLGLGLIFLLFFSSTTHFFQQAFVMLLRLRWFFLSILVLYFWMTPDTSLLTDSSNLFSFIPAGIISGLERIFSLVLVVLGVSYLLASLKQEQLIAAIYWLVSPFVYLGLERDKMVLRLAMGMEAVGRLSRMARVKDENENRVGEGKNFCHNFYYKITRSMQYYYQYALSSAKEDIGKEYVFDCLNPPVFWQWGFPLGLYLLFVLAGKI